MALSMGMLDTGLAVLSSGQTAHGWKAVAAFEVGMALTFIHWFMRKGREFQKQNKWLPVASVQALCRKVDHSANANAYYSKEEVVRAAKASGRTEAEGEALFARLDGDGNGVLDYSELSAIFKGGEHFSDVVPFEQARWIEKAFAVTLAPQHEMGKYFPVNPKAGTDVNHPWGRHFNKFTPPHKLYYFTGIGRSFLVLLVLHLLAPWPTAQAGTALGLEAVALALVIKDAPYVFIEQSRAEVVTSAGRVATYALALLPTIGAGPATTSSALMVNISFLMLLHSIVTQLYPAAWTVIKPIANLLLGEPLALAVSFIKHHCFPPKPLPAGYMPGDDVFVYVSAVGFASKAPRKAPADMIPADGGDVSDDDVKAKGGATSGSGGSGGGGAGGGKSGRGSTDGVAARFIAGYSAPAGVREMMATPGMRGVVVGPCPKARRLLFPKDWEKRVAIEAENGAEVFLHVGDAALTSSYDAGSSTDPLGSFFARLRSSAGRGLLRAPSSVSLGDGAGSPPSAGSVAVPVLAEFGRISPEDLEALRPKKKKPAVVVVEPPAPAAAPKPQRPVVARKPQPAVVAVVEVEEEAGIKAALPIVSFGTRFIPAGAVKDRRASSQRQLSMRSSQVRASR
jgi:hypothetical protein